MNLSPLLILTLVIGIIWFVPLACRKIHVPSIVGFIIAGILLGPSVLNIVSEGPTIKILGSLGMLYIMFQSGSEIDINDFKQYKYRSLFFGLCTFFIPFCLGIISSRYLLDFDWVSSMLLGAMYGSHTLMTYPIVSRYGVQKNMAVNITVGATMWAITFSLMVLAVVENGIGIQAWRSTGGSGVLGDWDFVLQEARWIGVLVRLAMFLVSVLWLFPRVARMFFKRHRDPISEFMVVMLMMVGSALLADLAGLEGILGAFLCGVSLNRLLPNRSPLMSRITFMGNSVFVPLFLISVGLMIDINAFWSGWTTLMIAAVMITTKLVGKSLAAWIAQGIFRFSKHERQLIYGLSHATAAGTLAIVTIAYQTGVLSAEVLNAAVLMILVLCTTASFITEHAAKELALQESAKLEADHEDDYWLLTSIGNRESDNGNRKSERREALREIGELASLDNIEIKQSADWQDVENMVEHTSKSVIVYHEAQPINTIYRLVVAVPRYAEKERDFITCFGLVRRLAGELGAKVVFYAHADTQVALQAMCRRPGKYLRASFRNMDGWEEVGILSQTIMDNDMLILLSSRKSTASYHPLFEEIPHMLTQHFMEYSSMVVYPEQLTGGPDMDTLLMEIPPASKTWTLISRLKKIIRRVIRSVIGERQ